VRIRSLAPPLNEIVGAIALAGTLIYAGHRISAGTLAAEHVLSFFVAVLMLYQPVKGLVRAQAIIEPGRAAWARLDDVLSHPGRLPAEGGLPAPDAPPTLRLDALTVHRGGRAVLSDLSAEIPAGRWTAIEGPNGAGKTTLAWVLARLLDPASGRVLVDEVPLNTLDPTSWRMRIGWMTQQPLLGRGTIEANVRSGEDADLEHAARSAGLAPIVARLPDGWQTVLGDDGAGLSGGEQQRVALARALARRPTVLILDEPTAHLDAAARADLVDRIKALRGHMTILLITHDTELAAQADQRIRLGA
jgi:ABC-type multidrug transport system fused ATPase/permease subunit